MNLLHFLALLILCTFPTIADEPSAFEGRELLKRFRREATPTMRHDITKEQKKLIVDKHNEVRRAVTPPAADMLYMSWDKRLEDLATEYSRGCVFKHNDKRSVEGFSYVGENLFVSSGVKIDDNYGPAAVTSWDDERASYTYETNSCKAGKVCGHYTQNVWAQSYKVGCGVTTCDTIQVYSSVWRDASILVCNYASGGNIGGQWPYQSGQVCSKCQPGDVCVDKLCTNATRDAEYTGFATSTYRTSFLRWSYLLLLCAILQMSPAILFN